MASSAAKFSVVLSGVAILLDTIYEIWNKHQHMNPAAPQHKRQYLKSLYGPMLGGYGRDSSTLQQFVDHEGGYGAWEMLGVLPRQIMAGARRATSQLTGGQAFNQDILKRALVNEGFAPVIRSLIGGSGAASVTDAIGRSPKETAGPIVASLSRIETLLAGLGITINVPGAPAKHRARFTIS